MSAPQFAAVDDDTNDLLSLVADLSSPLGRDDQDVFLEACRRDSMAHDGEVSVNRVRELLSTQGIEPHRYSAFWNTFTGRGRPMVKADGADAWETCSGSTSGNDGRPFRLRRWVGES